MRGGYRAGAGRKQGFAAKNAEEARRILSEMVMDEIKPIGKALITKAKKGDVVAARELFDRAFGKSSQTTKIDLTDERKPIPILDDLSNMTDEELYALADEYGIKPIYGGHSQNSEPVAK